MEQDVTQVDEVVVTALGISREKSPDMQRRR
jgi:hypothetical protein